MTELWQPAIVVRSDIHDATWIAHIEGTDLENTPAGPLRLVKAEVERQLRASGHDQIGWRKGNTPDVWLCTVLVPDG